MLFNSYTFIFLFLPITLAGFFLAGRLSPRLGVAWLALASLVFYAWWGPVFTLLLLGSILFNYAMSLAIASARGGRLRFGLLTAAVATDLGVLAYFKYAHFLVSSYAAVAGITSNYEPILMPLGISFFTFTQIAFLVDTYKEKVQERDFLNYLLFVTYFPHLVAGPVLHHAEMMPQFRQSSIYTFSSRAMCVGLAVFAIGLVKKTQVADYFAPCANRVFEHAQSMTAVDGALGTAQAWTGALCYTYQIYFDFSGYSDMAIGLALMTGIRLPLNFNSPYKAINIIDFWRRWHITLSRFLRDYLYIPLGGNKFGPWRRYSNLMITMLLGGLWHGAGWTFVVWGALHGIYLVICHGWQAIRPAPARRSAIGIAGAQLLTFAAVVLAWVFFRASDFESAIRILKAMAGLEGVWRGGLAMELGTIAGALVAAHLVVLFAPNTQQIISADPVRAAEQPNWLSWEPRPWQSVALGVMLALGVLSLSQVTDFIYFNF